MFVKIIKRKESLLFLALFIAGQGLLGWIFGNILVTSFSLKYIPIAPATALVFIALCILFLIIINSEKSKLTKSIVTSFVIIITFFCGLIFLRHIFNFNLDIENIFIKNPTTLGNVPVGHMSPLTALLFIFICISTMGIRQTATNAIKYIGGSVSLLVFLASSVLLIGYLYKAPFLYGSNIIPVAFPSAICLFLFSITLLRIYELKYWTFNIIKNNKVTLKLLKSFLPIIIFFDNLHGGLLRNFSSDYQSKVLLEALVLFIIVFITVLVIIRVSQNLGAQIVNAEQALKKSQLHLQSIFASMSDLIFVIDKDGIIIEYNNPNDDQNLYAPPELFLNKNYKEVLPPDIEDKIENAVQFLKSTGTPQSFDYSFSIQNKIYWYNAKLSSITDIDGRYNGITLIARNVTEPKQSEVLLLQKNNEYQELNDELIHINEHLNRAKEKIEETEERLRDYFQLGLLGMAITSTEKGWIEVNDTICEFLGYTKEELYQKTWSELTHPEDINLDFSFFERVQKDEIDDYKIDKRFIKKNGDVIYTELAVRCQRNSDRSIKYFLALINDISERKRAEQALQESEEQYRVSEMELKAAQSVAHLGNWKWNLKTSEIIWSDEMFQIFGIDKNSYTGRLGDTIAKVIHPDDVYLVLPENATEFAQKKTIEYRIILPDKTIRYILAIAGEAILDNNGNPLFLTGISQDITEQKQVQFKIQQQNNELIKLNADKDRLMSILAHDLKGPFHGILGLSELLADNIHMYNIDTIEKFVNNINKSAKFTFNLLEDLLLWAQSQSGKITYEPQKLVFTSICMEILETLNPIASEKNIAITLAATEGLTIYADRDMLKTIVRNLIANAIKFTNADGSINVIAEKNHENMLVSVKDNGIGIKKADLPKLFDISVMHSTVGTAGEKGTGLGLLLCKEFVERHGGRFWVESEVGRGSDFKFTLPVTSEENKGNGQ
jgi:PAS domain S-box-containing protein